MSLYDFRTDTAVHAAPWSAQETADTDYSYPDDTDTCDVVVRWNSSPELWLAAVRELVDIEVD